MVLWEIFSLGDIPYPGVDISEIRQRVVGRDRLRLGRPELALDCIHQLMQMCQEDDPQMRPTFSQLTLIFKQIAQEYRLGKLSPPMQSPEPRSMFANSLYDFDGSSTFGMMMSPSQGADGYLLPSSPTSTTNAHTYLPLQEL